MSEIKSREDLARYFAQLGFIRGAEIGVDVGEYSRILCESNPELHLNCVDLWERRGGKLEEAKQNLAPYRVKLMQKSSTEAVKEFDIGSLDFVYIDAAHDFDNVMRDIIEWGMRVKKGGIISGHDYANNRHCGVEDAVNIYAKHHGYKVHLLEEPSAIWQPRHPNENNRTTGISWWIKT